MYLIKLYSRNDMFSDKRSIGDNGTNVSCVIYANKIIQEDTVTFKLIDCKNTYIDLDAPAIECSIYVKNNSGLYSRIFQPLQLDKFTACDKDAYLHLNNDFVSEGWLKSKIFKYFEVFPSCEKRYWLNLEEEERFNWCSSCRYFNTNPQQFNSKFVINGRFIDSKGTFLCEFAERIIGIGGYFGSNWDAFDDCLGSYYNEHPLYEVLKNITVVWTHFDTCHFEGKEIALEILEENGVKLVRK